MAQVLVVFSSLPYSGSHSVESVDFAMAATNYGHQIQVLFEDEGIYMLMASQKPDRGHKSIEKKIKAMPLFDIEHLYVCDASCKQNGIELNLGDDYTRISTERKLALFDACDFMVRF